jgi:hypothetical protein
MPGKIARSDPRPSVRVTEVLLAVSTSRLSCKKAGKARTLMPVWDSSGESRPTPLLSLPQGLGDQVNRRCLNQLETDWTGV